jgi:hypothetical protein
VPTFTLYIALRAEEPLDDVAVAAVAGVRRPEDDELGIWRDGENSTVMRVSAECSAADLEAALEIGHGLAEGILGLSPFSAAVEEVQAMTDEDVLVWRAEP